MKKIIKREKKYNRMCNYIFYNNGANNINSSIVN